MSPRPRGDGRKRAVVHLYGDSNSVGFKDARSHLWQSMQRRMGGCQVFRIGRGGATFGPAVREGRTHFLQWLTGPKTGFKQNWHCSMGGTAKDWEAHRNPAVAVIMLGTNDISQWDQDLCGEFSDYKVSLKLSIRDLVSRIRSSPGSACKVIFLLPVWGPKRRSAV